MKTRKGPGRLELTGLLAWSMALSALGIDLILPAFTEMRVTLGLAPDSTALGGLITAYFLGLAGGQLVYGPVSDRFGRRPVLYAGLVVYALGALLGAVAPNLGLLYVARFIWGLGAAGPRVVTQAVIRDTYEGDAMAKAMSMVMAVFLLVPIVAPTIGAAAVDAGSWRWIFVGCVGAALVIGLWAQRLPETLHPEHRMELSFRRVGRAAKLVVSHREALVYTLAQIALYGAFTGYLGSSEIIFTETFDDADRFPLYFGFLGLVMGIAMFTNSRIVSRLGARRVVHSVLIVYLAAGAAFVATALATDGVPPVAVFLAFMAVLAGCHALIIPNSASIAMVPMAAVAGTASSLMGAALIAGGALLGNVVDRFFDGTITPLAIGFLGYGIVAAGLVVWIDRGRMFARVPQDEASMAVVFEV